MSNKKIIFFLKNTLFFLIISVVPKIGGFIIIPIITNYVSSEDYGKIDLLLNIITILVPVMTLSIANGVYRYSIDEKDRTQDVYKIGLFITNIGWIGYSFILLVLWLYGVWSRGVIVFAFLFADFFLKAVSMLNSYYSRGVENNRALMASSFTQMLVLIVLVVLLIPFLGLSDSGYIMAIVLSDLASIIVMMPLLKLPFPIYLKLPDKLLLTNMVAYTFPYIFSDLAWWINNLSDRYILKFFYGSWIVGVYAISNKIPSILSVIYTGVIKAVQISTIKDTDGDEGKEFWNTMYSEVKFLMLIISMMLIVCNKLIGSLLFRKDFIEGVKYAPLLVCGCFFKVVADVCLAVTIKEKRSKLHMFILVITAFTNCIGNFILIPQYSAYGAAIATMLSFLFMWGMSYMFTQKIMQNSKKSLIGYADIAMILGLTMIETSYYSSAWIEVIIVALAIIIHRQDVKRITDFARTYINKM